MTFSNKRTESANRSRRGQACLFVTCLISLAGCTTEQLPVGAELQLAPESISINIEERLDENGRCLIDPQRYVDKAVVLALTDAQGSPIGGAEVKVYADWSGNTFPGFPVLGLYDDRGGNNNGVVDPETELVSGADDSVATVRTDRFGGDRVLMLRVNLSCTYAGVVFAYVDGVTASLQVDITSDSPDETEAAGAGDGREGWQSPFELTADEGSLAADGGGS